MLGLLMTLFASLFFLIGALISLKIKNKNKLYSFAIGLSIITFLGIIIFDLIPEIKNCLKGLNLGIFLSIIFIILGFLSLFLIDKMIPSHNHIHKKNEKNIKEHNSHIFHISFLTSLGVIIHNLIEGMSIYIITYTSLFSGLIMALSVGFHNIPIGIQVGISSQNKQTKRVKFLLILLILSTIIGGFLVFLFNIILETYIMGLLISLTIGMTLYLIIFEFLKEILNNNDKKTSLYGMTLGCILIFLNILIG